MSRVAEIERAIEQLTPAEFTELAHWITARHQDHWDRQLDHDAAAGRLDFLLEESRREDRP